MKNMKKRCFMIGCLVPVVLTVVIVVALTIYYSIIESRLRFEDSIHSILGLENVEAKYIDKERTWSVDYEVYKLSDKDVKDFLEKPNKTIPNMDGFEKENWTRASIDSLTTHLPLSYYGGIKESYSRTTMKLYYDDSYYALHRNGPNIVIMYMLDEKNKLLYITSYWL